jgi:hypothetical protein
MAGGPMLINQFTKLFASRLPYLTELIGPDTWKESPEVWQQLYNVKTSKKLQEQFLLWGGFGPFAEMAENGAVTYDMMEQGPSFTVSHTLYGLGFQIGFLVGQWDMDGIIGRCAPELARSMRNTIQLLAAAPWNGAVFQTKTADGLYLLSASHTFIRASGTWSNYPGNVALSNTSLETALVAFQKMKNPMGDPMAMEPAYLVIPPDLTVLANKLLATPKLTGGDYNDVSYVYNKLTPIVWPYLTSSDRKSVV